MLLPKEYWAASNLHMTDRSFKVSRFLPWIGAHYEQNAFKIPVLLIGESHYCEDHPISDLGNDFTQDVFRRIRDGELKTSTTSALERTLNPLLESGVNLWDEIAFYNYLQNWVARDPTDRPISSIFHQSPSPEALVEVLHQLRPQLVVILGTGLFKTLSEDEPGPVLMVSEESHRTWLYDVVTSTPALAVGIKHPGKFYTADKWRPVVRSAISYVKEQLIAI